MAPVTLRNLTKIFTPPVRVLDDITLKVADGEFLAILGPSGCGKSTILRCLAGLEPPTSGELLIGDHVVNDLAPAERDVAMVFQSYALYPHLTVRQNLAFPLEMRGVPRGRHRAMVEQVAARLELTSLLDRMPGQLSGGQRQRVALGRAMIRAPRVFLFDEPLSNLDAALRVQLRAELMALHRSLGATMLYVTHDQVEALTMGQRVAVMHQGRIQQLGTPAEVYGRPANTFVARFVGSPGMNLVEGEVLDGRFQAGSLTVPVPEALPEAPARMGIRPEHLALHPVTAHGVQGTVSLVERLGSETLVHLTIGPGSAVVARVPGLVEWEAGHQVRLDWQVTDVHWFGAEGNRL